MTKNWTDTTTQKISGSSLDRKFKFQLRAIEKGKESPIVLDEAEHWRPLYSKMKEMDDTAESLNYTHLWVTARPPDKN